ncbi:MAG: hypothetical protein WBW93_19315 [Steroidobacteraceae bacterium]
MSPARIPATLFAAMDADPAAAKRQASLDLPRGDGSGQWHDEVRVVILHAPKSTTSYSEARNASATRPFRTKPPWSEAIPTRIMVFAD